MVSGSADNTVRLWDANTGRELRKFSGHTEGVIGVAFSPDGTRIASGSGGRFGRWGGWDYAVHLWDANTGSHLRTLNGHRDRVNSLSFSPDGATLASGSYDDTARLWDVNTGSHLRTLDGHTDWIRDVSFSPDGTTIATASGDNTVRLWDANTGRELRILKGHTTWVRSASFSPDGKTIVSGSYDDTARLWDANTGSELRTLKGHRAGAASVLFSPDGTIILSGSYDGTARLWDANTGSELHTLTGHTGAVVNVAFSPDGTTVATGSWDRTARLWDASTGSPLRTLTGHTAEVNGISFSPDSNTLATGSYDGTVLVWELKPSTIPDVPEPIRRKEDVTGDGTVNIQDLVAVAANLGQLGDSPADVNRDGIVNIQDLVLVAGALDASDSAPALNPQAFQTFTIADVEKWLQEAQQLPLTDPAFQRGILILEQLLATLTPKQTALLPNYPNPFNPETWIPYQLSKPANVNISIYTAEGTLVWRLALGTQGAGIYESRSRAAYWNGRNTDGEPVASGLYLYTLTAGDFSATRRMVILK